MSNLVEISGVKKGYGISKTVFEDLNLVLPEGKSSVCWDRTEVVRRRSSRCWLVCCSRRKEASASADMKSDRNQRQLYRICRSGRISTST